MTSFIHAIAYDALPEAEYESAMAINRNLGSLRQMVERFNDCLNLFDFSMDQFQESKVEGEPLSKVCEQMLSWSRIASRDGAMSIWEFANSLHLTRSNLNKCPVLKTMVSGSSLERSISLFHTSFPSAENMRNAVAHPTALSGTPFKQRQNSFSGSYHKHGVKISGSHHTFSGISGRNIIETIYGQIIEYEISAQSLHKLHDVTDSLMKTLETAFKLTQDHLANLGTEDARKNPLQPLSN